jgi:hypothetical protein
MYVLRTMLKRKIYLSIRPSNDYIYNVYSLSLLWNKYKHVCLHPNYTQYIYSDNIPHHITFHNIHLYVHMYVHPVYPTDPTCTRERTPSSGEHVYAPGRTPSSGSICHMWMPERTLKLPQAVLHVNPKEDTPK